jgi:hypothetical protein
MEQGSSTVVVDAAGPGNAVILSIFQYLNLVLSSIGYTVAAGQSLRCVLAVALLL